MKFPLGSSQVGKSQIRIQTSSTNSWPKGAEHRKHIPLEKILVCYSGLANLRTYIYLHRLPKPAHDIGKFAKKNDILCLDLGPVSTLKRPLLCKKVRRSVESWPPPPLPVVRGLKQNIKQRKERLVANWFTLYGCYMFHLIHVRILRFCSYCIDNAKRLE